MLCLHIIGPFKRVIFFGQKHHRCLPPFLRIPQRRRLILHVSHLTSSTCRSPWVPPSHLSRNVPWAKVMNSRRFPGHLQMEDPNPWEIRNRGEENRVQARWKTGSNCEMIHIFIIYLCFAGGSKWKDSPKEKITECDTWPFFYFLQPWILGS